MTVVAGATMLRAARSLPREVLSDGSPIGAAWTIGPVRRIAQGFGIGTIIGLAIAILAEHQARHHAPSLVKTVSAIALAPPIEEMLFRGLLYGGYRRSFGPVWAAILTTVLFVAPHVPQSMPAAIGLSANAVVVLFLRLHSASVGPAVAAHMAYNGTIAAVLFLYGR
jgi:membrane protease YdiL (CAAX protease family)